MFVSELLQDPGINGLLKSFQDSIFAQKIDKRRRHEAYSFIGARISKSNWLNYPNLPMVRLAAQLAWEGHLPSVEKMELKNKNLSDIPNDKMGKLASIVTNSVSINNITPASLDIMLDNVTCSRFELYNMRLTEPQTRALVTALTERLKAVVLYGVTLDIQTLCQYNGRGRCRELVVRNGDPWRRFKEKLQWWAAEVGWAVTWDGPDLRTKRKKILLC